MDSIQATLVKREYSPSSEVALLTFQTETLFSFSEGQFMMIELTTAEGKKMKKPYSIATTSLYFEKEKEIGCVVKKTRNGGMSEQLVEKLPLGSTVTLKGPVGHYVNPGVNSHYLLISVGSGLSPNVGLFDSLLYKQEFSSITLIHGERYFSYLVPSIHQRFLEVSMQDERVRYIPVFSREEDLPLEGKKGYVQEQLQESISQIGVNVSCFVCGKPEMVDDVRIVLEKLGVDKQNIAFERY